MSNNKKKWTQWSNQEKDILKAKYGNTKTSDLSSSLQNRGVATIVAMARSLGLTKDFFWTKNEDDLLKKIFPTASHDELLKAFPGKTLNSIRSRAYNGFGLKTIKSVRCPTEEEVRYLISKNVSYRDVVKKYGISNTYFNRIANRLGIKKNDIWANKRRSQIGILLNRDVSSMYWMGFLCADGHFNGSCIMIALCKKDFGHFKKLLKFVRYVGAPKKIIKKPKTICGNITSKTYTSYWASFGNKEVVCELMSRFGIVSDKTKTPISTDELVDENMFLAWLCGFIDGDGSISNYSKNGKKTNGCRCTIGCYKTWHQFFKFMSHKINRIFGCEPRLRFDKQMIRINITNQCLVQIKKFAIKNGLPIMNRKWDKINIDDDFVIKEEFKDFIISKYVSGKSVNDICVILKNKRSRQAIQSCLRKHFGRKAFHVQGRRAYVYR